MDSEQLLDRGVDPDEDTVCHVCGEPFYLCNCGGSEQDFCNEYRVTKSDGTQIDPKAQFFILRVDTDPCSRRAVRTYANSIFDDDPLLANSLVNWMRELDEESGVNTA